MDIVYVGDATLIEGARPDVAQTYPQFPNNTRAGWDYSFITNTLPDGLAMFDAYATDKEGNEQWIGGHGVIVDNANAVKPFGAIDTPTQGGEASGSSFRMNGWVLTPMPNKIPIDGSTINVFVDGKLAGNPTYNIYREDIATLFPGYANSSGAGWYFDLDTTPYTDGVHTIQWTASDDADNTDGIGSRYFTINNIGETKVDTDIDDTLPKEFALFPAYPNPFNPATRITYNIPEKTRISLWVVDILGHRIRTLMNSQFQRPGKHTVEWLGNNDSGILAPSGVYLLILHAGQEIFSQKVILLR